MLWTDGKLEPVGAPDAPFELVRCPRCDACWWLDEARSPCSEDVPEVLAPTLQDLCDLRRLGLTGRSEHRLEMLIWWAAGDALRHGRADVPDIEGMLASTRLRQALGTAASEEPSTTNDFERRADYAELLRQSGLFEEARRVALDPEMRDALDRLESEGHDFRDGVTTTRCRRTRDRLRAIALLAEARDTIPRRVLAEERVHARIARELPCGDVVLVGDRPPRGQVLARLDPLGRPRWQTELPLDDAAPRRWSAVGATASSILLADGAERLAFELERGTPLSAAER